MASQHGEEEGMEEGMEALNIPKVTVELLSLVLFHNATSITTICFYICVKEVLPGNQQTTKCSA